MSAFLKQITYLTIYLRNDAAAQMNTPIKQQMNWKVLLSNSRCNREKTVASTIKTHLFSTFAKTCEPSL